MKIIIEGPDKEVQKVMKENRLRAARGTIEMYPCSKTCDNSESSSGNTEDINVLKEKVLKLSEENKVLKAKLDVLSDSKEVKDADIKSVEEVDSKNVEKKDSKGVEISDNKSSKEGGK